MAIRYGTPPANETPEVVEATEARSGSWGRHILWVLVISTILAAAALLGSWAFSARGLDGQGGQSRVETGAAAVTGDAAVVTPKSLDTEPPAAAK